MLKECQKRLQRNELARFYHWSQRNRLAPLNLYKRHSKPSRGDSRISMSDNSEDYLTRE